MSAEVFQFRQPKVKGLVKTARLPRYECKCGSQDFNLLQDMSVSCSFCKKLIWHLKVTDIGRGA